MKQIGIDLKVKEVANDLNLSKLKSFVNICGVDSERQKEAIIAIKTDEGEGTGFLITPDGYAITCNHVIFKANKITARIRRKLSYDGYFDSEYECAVIKTDPIADIALIKLVNNIENGKSVDNTPFLKLFDEINQEDIAYDSNKTFSLFGYPGGISINDNISYAQGKIMSKRTKESGIDCFWLDVTAIKGNSGSPVIYNDTGEVYGVLCGSDLFTGEHTEEINYMCPVKYIWKLLCDIEN